MTFPAMDPTGTQFVADLGGVSNPAIYDVVSAPNTPLDTGILDVSAWRGLFICWQTSAGTAQMTLSQVDDAGAGFVQMAAYAASTGQQLTVGPGAASIGGQTGVPCYLPRRIRVTSTAAGVGNTVRIRIEGRR